MTFGDDIITGFKSLQSVMGLIVTVSRGTATTQVVAVPGDSTHQFSQDGLVTNEVQSRDWLLLAADYKFGGVLTLPQRNDKITSNGVVYSILSNAGEAYFRYSDNLRQVLRVHCKPG